MEMGKRQVLLVDDEAVNLEILQEYFEDEDSLSTVSAEGGERAWQLLLDPENEFKLILLDRMMPDLDGLTLLRRIKADNRLARIPVILQTAADSAEAIREGLQAGAYYYLTKPYRHDKLMAIVHAALADAEERAKLGQKLAQHINCLGLMNHAEFSIRTIDEAGQLAAFVAQACPNPETAAMGLSELLINAIEHGNLGLSYAEKTQLKQSDTWHAEIRRRSSLHENCEKHVMLSYWRDEHGITFRIADQGNGFAWQKYLDFDPSRAFDPNGRGIALARMLSFSSIRYEGNGNVAVACVDLPFSEPGRPQ